MTRIRTMRLARLAGAALLTTVAALAAPRAARAQGFVVIVNAENSVSTLPKAEVSQMFLKKVTEWPNGNPVVVVDQAERSPTRFNFSKAVHGRSTTAVKTYWQQQVFSGRGVPPTERASDAEVVAFVRDTPNAIGYVAAGAPLPGGVKAVTLLTK